MLEKTENRTRKVPSGITQIQPCGMDWRKRFRPRSGNRINCNQTFRNQL